MTSAYFDGMSQYFGSRAYAVVPPTGSGADDAATWRAALDAGLELVLQQELYTLSTTLTLYSGDRIRFNGATVNVAIPAVDGVTGAALFCSTTDHGDTLTLAADTTVGATTFTLTSISDSTGRLAVGGYIVLAYPDKNCLQAFRIKSITGSANPYTITIDPVSKASTRVHFVFPAASTSVYASTLPIGIRLHGEGATFIATPPGSNVLVDRGFELACAIDCLCEDFTLRGPFGWGASFDDGSAWSVMRHLTFDLDTAHSTVGYASECNDQCRFEHIKVRNPQSTNAASGVYAYSGFHVVHDQIDVENCSIGGSFDVADVLASEQVKVIDSRFSYNAAGISVSNGYARGTFERTSISNNTGNGVLFNTNNSGAPTGNVFQACKIRSNGNDGIDFVTGADNALIDCEISGNTSHGLEVAAAVTGTLAMGRAGSWSGNGGDMITTAGDIWISGLRGYNNATGGLRVTGSANAWVTNTEIGYSSGSATVQCYICQSTGFIRCENVRATASGTTGNKSAFITTTGTIWLHNAVIDGSSMTFGLFRNGGGSLKYDETLTNSATTVRTGGTLTTTSSNEASYA